MRYRFMILRYNTGKDGYTAVTLRVTKDRKRKYISTGLRARPEQWDEHGDRFIADRRLVPRYREYNTRLSELEARVNAVLRDFDSGRIDWTLNQFETAYVGKVSKGRVRDYFGGLIDTLRETGHIGNAICYSRTMHMMELFDNRLDKKVFPEIDIKYVKAFDIFLQKRGCRGNTRKYYLKALRAVLNKAIQDKEAPESTYPFGKGGFNIAALEEETAKRYLSHETMQRIKTCPLTNPVLEKTRRLFLFMYYCYGISFIDAALLTRANIVRRSGGDYIVYKRRKTKESKNAKAIHIRITPQIQELMNWFAANTVLTADYLLPIVSVQGCTGERLYRHIRGRYRRNGQYLACLGRTLGLTGMRLTSYCARHTMAMTLQDHRVPREVIAQILGHKNLSTTSTYLDSFTDSVIDEAARVL
ncbi:MAG TPA: site-specific integrase [Candidatus Coprenecus pullistercoris]|nr:site-specific integrase [Candidatus Coprenecus pullistercoris]